MTSPYKLSMEERTVIAGIAIGLTGNTIAVSAGWSASRVNKIRRRLLTALDVPGIPHLVVALVGAHQVTPPGTAVAEWASVTFGHDYAKPALDVLIALQTRAFNEHDVRDLMTYVIKYPRVESHWGSSNRSATVQRLLDRVGLDPRSVSNPMIVVLAACAELGQVKPENLPRPPQPPVTYIGQVDGEVVTVLAPGHFSLALQVDGSSVELTPK